MVEVYTAIAIQRASISAGRDASVDDAKANMKKNIEHIGVMLGQGIRIFDEMIPPKLVAIPEGTLGQTAPTTTDPSRRIMVTIPGEETDLLGELAKKYEMFLVGNASETDPKYEKVNGFHHFTSNFVIDPRGKIILRYRKVNPWIPLEHATSPHDVLDMYDEPLFPVVDTEIGKIGTYVCYDQYHPEVVRQLRINGAEITIKPTSFCSPFQMPPTEHFEIFNRARCIENQVYGVYPNVISRGRGYLGGGSMIVDYMGRILSAAPVGESEAVIGAEINIDALRKMRQGNLHNSPKHIRSEAYDYLKKQIYPKNKLLS